MVVIERLSLASRNSAGLNRADGRLLHIIPDVAMQIAPSRYNLNTTSGLAKFTLYEDHLDIKYFVRNIANRLTEKENMTFKGSTEFLAEKLVEMYQKMKLW